MARQDELKKILEQLQNKTIDSAAASKALEGMFTRIESDMGKIRDAEGAPGKGIESAIKVQYVGLSDTLGKMGEESAESLGRIFGSYRTLFQEQLAQSIGGAAELNRMLSKSGANVLRTFNDFKGLSLQATKETSSLMARSVDSLLKTMTMDEIKPFLVSTTKAFKANFKAIAFEIPEVEAKYYKLAAAFEAMGVSANKSATYFQDLKNVGRMTADEVGIAGLEIQKIAELTNGDFDGMMQKFHKLVVQQGYDKKEAVAALKEMQIQTMKTGVDFDSLSNIFGKGLDNFSQIAPKVAELNSVFKLRLNPAAMTRMTAKERAQYITSALKNSNVDLNSRLLQRQLSSVFGNEEAARKYLSSIRNTNEATTEAIAATRKKLDAVGAETVSGADALKGLQKIAVDQMDPARALSLRQKESATKSQIRSAGGIENLETKSTAGYQMRTAAQEKLFSELQTEAGKLVQDTVTNFQMLQAEFGNKLKIGTIVAAGATGIDLFTKAADVMVAANNKKVADLDKEIKTTEEGSAKRKKLEAQKKSLEEASQNLQTQKLKATSAGIKNLPEETLQSMTKFLKANLAPENEAPGDQIKRVKGEVKQVTSSVSSGLSSASDSVINSVDTLVKALKSMPIVLKLNGEELTRAVLKETGTGEN